MTLLSLAILLAFSLLQRCDAVCCKNYKPECFLLSQDCTPNCADLVSYCDLTAETCLDDNWGGCQAIVTTTVYLDVYPISQSTVYTASILAYSDTSVLYQSVTVGSVEVQTSTAYTTSYITTTVTVPGPTSTVTMSPDARQKEKRQDPSTTVVYESSLVSTSIAIYYAGYTTYAEAYTSSYVTIDAGYTSIIPYTSTIYSTETVTVTAPGVTYTVQARGGSGGGSDDMTTVTTAPSSQRANDDSPSQPTTSASASVSTSSSTSQQPQTQDDSSPNQAATWVPRGLWLSFCLALLTGVVALVL